MATDTTLTVPEMPEEAGLNSEEVARKLREYGPNIIEKAKEVNFLTIAIKEITEPMILLLLAVGVLYSIWGSIEDAAIITVVILLLISAEVWTSTGPRKRSMPCPSWLRPGPGRSGTASLKWSIPRM